MERHRHHEEKVTKHHVFFERRDYKTHSERELREHELSIVPMSPESHNQGPDSLHANVEAPPKPDRGMVLGALALLSEMQQDGTGQIEAVQELANMFGHARHDRARNEEIADNLNRQLDYIQEGIIYKRK